METKTQRPFRIIYMGTPLFALPALKALSEAEEVVLVVTQPDRPSGRGRKLAVCPVKEEAKLRGIPLLQPESIGDPRTVQTLREASCDVIVAAAFGQMLPPEILEMPPHGCINIHASLLPKYRGASPITEAIRRGEESTGITTMVMDRGMDTGDILLQESLEISSEDTAGTLSDRLSRLGARLVVNTLEALKQGRLERKKQVESEATYAPLLKKAQGEMNWHQDAKSIGNHVRAMDPWPGAYTRHQSRPIKIWRVAFSEEKGAPGEILCAKDRLVVGALDGSVVVEELQLPGKKRVKGPDFLRGRHGIQKGMIFGA